ncbi:hypothetical protein EVAR_45078_1 [Eumeta japonica]|uniref:Uncharacterized protein n=1 Tax=Eumeta variegata TaxID=151549 RepID=A0A4C1XVX3_EUMVA|nr:hypothetical protein EVAR_45078_1 [Eumeta japonica]
MDLVLRSKDMATEIQPPHRISFFDNVYRRIMMGIEAGIIHRKPDFPLRESKFSGTYIGREAQIRAKFASTVTNRKKQSRKNFIFSLTFAYPAHTHRNLMKDNRRS